MTKPDFSDPLSTYVGCFLMAIGVPAGFLIAFLGEVTGLVPDPNPDMTYDFPLWLAQVSLCAVTIGILASASLMSLVERVRVLWRVGDAVVMVSWLVLPAVVVVILTWTPTGAALLVPLSIASLIFWAVGTLLSIAWFVRATVRQRASARVMGQADGLAHRPAKIEPNRLRSIESTTAPRGQTEAAPLSPAMRMLLLLLITVGCLAFVIVMVLLYGE